MHKGKVTDFQFLAFSYEKRSDDFQALHIRPKTRSPCQSIFFFDKGTKQLITEGKAFSTKYVKTIGHLTKIINK